MNKNTINIKLQHKECIVCGKIFSNRKKWAKIDIWERIKYCPNRCRKLKNVKIK